MKKLSIPSNVTRAFYKAGLQLKKHSPEILVTAGIIGTVTSAVMACKATTKLSDILDNAKNDIDMIHECVANPEQLPEVYTPEDGKKDLAIVYAQTGVKLVKLYAPSVALGVISIAAIVTSNGILRKENLALAAAYTAVETGFKDYRKRAVERFGKDLDRELRLDLKAKEIETTVVNEDGSETTVKTVVSVPEIEKYSEYARCFDETCLGWERDSETNLYTLRCVEAWANEKLQTEGFVFLNDIYEALGMPKTRAGQVVGWYYDEKRPIGDNRVDLGIYDISKEGCRRFVNGYEKSIWIDPNVDGTIIDYI